MNNNFIYPSFVSFSACRYEKGTWSECITGQMSRTDKLKSSSDPTCQSTRVVNKNCNPGKSKDKSNKDRKNKDKGKRNKVKELNIHLNMLGV